LALHEVADPSPDPGQVLVRVRATAVNRADLLQRRGRYPAPPGSPADIPGLELAGEIESCGAGVEGRSPGARVMAIVGGGAYAERVAFPAGFCIDVPHALAWEDAAAIPEAFLTAWDAAVVQARLAPGETLLVTAAGSGVGTAAVQLGAALGARVVALARSAGKRARLAALGAAAVLDPGDPDLATLLRASAGGAGVDVVLDLVGASGWPVYLATLAERGRIVVVGTLSGSKLELDLSAVMRRRATVLGTVLRSRPDAEKAALSAAFTREVLPRFAGGSLHPVIDRVLPLAQAAEAHRVVEADENFGKVVLRVG